MKLSSGTQEVRAGAGFPSSSVGWSQGEPTKCAPNELTNIDMPWERTGTSGRASGGGVQSHWEADRRRWGGATWAAGLLVVLGKL